MLKNSRHRRRLWRGSTWVVSSMNTWVNPTNPRQRGNPVRPIQSTYTLTPDKFVICPWSQQKIKRDFLCFEYDGSLLHPSQCTSSGSHDANKPADAMSAPDTSAVMNKAGRITPVSGWRITSKRGEKKCADKNCWVCFATTFNIPNINLMVSSRAMCYFIYSWKGMVKYPTLRLLKISMGDGGSFPLSVVNTFTEMKERW